MPHYEAPKGHVELGKIRFNVKAKAYSEWGLRMKPDIRLSFTESEAPLRVKLNRNSEVSRLCLMIEATLIWSNLAKRTWGIWSWCGLRFSVNIVTNLLAKEKYLL